MLLEISIKNFAIIEAISLNFEKGMTVLTGETGAGKSIIIDAMNLMLGARATTDVIRHGAPKAEIEGLFSVENSRLLQELFEEQGLEFGDEIIIRREILQNGRSVSRVNGQMVNLCHLKFQHFDTCLVFLLVFLDFQNLLAHFAIGIKARLIGLLQVQESSITKLIQHLNVQLRTH